MADIVLALMGRLLKKKEFKACFVWFGKQCEPMHLTMGPQAHGINH
jgi:hypothetical protein